MSTQPTTSDLASSVGGFVLGFVVGTEQKAEAQTAVTNTAISSYVQIGSDNSVIIMFGGCELGRGSMTGLARCAAEDLMVDWRAVKIVTLINSTTYYGTGGSSAMRFFSNVWRIACATARRMLIDAAAPMWSVASSLCTAAHGAVTHNGNTLTYGQLATTNFRIVSQPMLPSAY